MSENRDFILATVLFSTTLTLLVVLSVARYRSCPPCLCNLDRTWSSPPSLIVEQTLTQANGGGICISRFDDLFREISCEHATDWHLMSAIAYAESRFKPQAISKFGAVGLMQVMPRSAAEFGVSSDKLHDPQVNIWVANKIFNHIAKMLAFPAHTSERDRISMTLAAYNCGIGRIFDAQRLARSDSRDPYNWPELSLYLYRLNNPQYYGRAEVYHGRFRGGPTTLAYIDTVLESYDSYRRQNRNEAWRFVWK